MSRWRARRRFKAVERGLCRRADRVLVSFSLSPPLPRARSHSHPCCQQLHDAAKPPVKPHASAHVGASAYRVADKPRGARGPARTGPQAGNAQCGGSRRRWLEHRVKWWGDAGNQNQPAAAAGGVSVAKGQETSASGSKTRISSHNGRLCALFPDCCRNLVGEQHMYRGNSAPLARLLKCHDCGRRSRSG